MSGDLSANGDSGVAVTRWIQQAGYNGSTESDRQSDVEPDFDSDGPVGFPPLQKTQKKCVKYPIPIADDEEDDLLAFDPPSPRRMGEKQQQKQERLLVDSDDEQSSSVRFSFMSSSEPVSTSSGAEAGDIVSEARNREDLNVNTRGSCCAAGESDGLQAIGGVGLLIAGTSCSCGEDVNDNSVVPWQPANLNLNNPSA